METMIAVMAVILLFLAWYNNSSKRNKIYCSFTRRNRTKIHKWVKMTDRFIMFEKGKYHIIPTCIVLEWWDKGLLGMIFPQNVATMDFTHGSAYPIDPNTLRPVVLSPEAMGAMNKEEWAKSYFKNFSQQPTKKQSMLQQYLPYIAIILVVLVGFYLYSNMQAISANMIQMQNAIKSITK